jgi:hypothetical protein
MASASPRNVVEDYNLVIHPLLLSCGRIIAEGMLTAKGHLFGGYIKCPNDRSCGS